MLVSIKKINWRGLHLSNGTKYILYTILAYMLISMVFVMLYYRNA